MANEPALPTHEPGTLVVDTTEIDVVRQFLTELDIDIAHEDPLPKFELALLTLAHVGGDQVTDVDPVLAELRRRIAARCGGWTPLLGKNRMMATQFNSYPQTKSMNFMDPKPVAIQSEEFFSSEAGAGAGGSGVRVGLVDTLIYNHPDLESFDIRPDLPKFEIEEQKQYTVEQGHGVFTAGLILQQAPEATLLTRQALRDDGRAAAWDVVTKLHDFLTEGNQVDVVVLASGCRTHDGHGPSILSRAIERLSEHTLVVAATGNHGELEGISADVHITRNSATWPAALPRVVSVGVSLPEDGGIAGYIPDLPWVTCTVVAPRSDGTFVSTYLKATDVKMHQETADNDFDGYAAWFGSSCAAAFLGGAIAARMSARQLSAKDALEDLYGDVVKKYDWQLRKTP